MWAVVFACMHAAHACVVQGEFLVELAVDIKPPKDWHKVCSTKKVHRWRPPQVTTAVSEREQASERLQVAHPFLPFPNRKQSDHTLYLTNFCLLFDAGLS